MNKQIILILLLLLSISITLAFIFLIFGFNKNNRYTKGELLDVFNKNYDKFENIVNFAEKRGNFSIVHNKNTISIEFNSENESNNSIYNEALFILKKLKFTIISGQNEYIEFVEYRNIKDYSGGYEQGIVYSKNSVEPNFFKYVEPIRGDKWYYYWTTYE